LSTADQPYLKEGKGVCLFRIGGKGSGLAFCHLLKPVVIFSGSTDSLMKEQAVLQECGKEGNVRQVRYAGCHALEEFFRGKREDGM
jgi:hypothetical protein